MAVTDGYATVEELRERIDILDAHEPLIEQLITAASRRIDTRCGRHFYLEASATARRFAVEWGDRLDVDDIGDTAGLVIKTDEDGDGTFEITWTSTDYHLTPFDGKLNGRAWPYTGIEVAPRGVRSFPRGSWPAVQVTAKWGWPAVPEEIKEACLLIVGRLYRRKETPFGVTGSLELGTMRLPFADPDVEALVWPFVHVGVRAAG